MEIREVVSYFLNIDTNILDVTFRTIDDSDDVIRIDNIDFSLTEDYGFDLIQENFNFFDDDFEDDLLENENDEVELDEDELLSFLNEYYLLESNTLPESQIF